MSSIEEQLRKIAAGLGIVQGAAYGILALICICLYYKGVTFTYFNYSYMDFVNQMLYEAFLDGYNGPLFSGMSLRPKVFVIFAWIHLILDLVWILASLRVFKKESPKQMIEWSYVTFVISFWDLVTVIILGSDYHKCLNVSGQDVLSQGLCATTIIPVLVIAAKGFVLWIVNVTFAVILNKQAIEIKKEALTQQLRGPTLTTSIVQQPVTPSNVYYNAQNNFGDPMQPFSGPYRPQRFFPPQPSPQNFSNHSQNPVSIPETDYYH